MGYITPYFIDSMIKQNDSPEKGINTNKFISSIKNEGMRGQLLALTDDKMEGVILAHNSSFDNEVVWGNLYHVKEMESGSWPRVVRRVDCIPIGFKVIFS